MIHVADVFDAIVTKRQYTTHIHISDTLKMLLKDAIPSKQSIALDALHTDSKYGKINIKILYALFKIVIDDILYEISCILDYEKYLKEQLKRLEKIDKYYNLAKNATRQSKKDYYAKYATLLFDVGETFQNYEQVTKEYRDAFEAKENAIKLLYLEIDIIKGLREA